MTVAGALWGDPHCPAALMCYHPAPPAPKPSMPVQPLVRTPSLSLKLLCPPSLGHLVPSMPPGELPGGPPTRMLLLQSRGNTRCARSWLWAAIATAAADVLLLNASGGIAARIPLPGGSPAAALAEVDAGAAGLCVVALDGSAGAHLCSLRAGEARLVGAAAAAMVVHRFSGRALPDIVLLPARAGIPTPGDSLEPVAAAARAVPLSYALAGDGGEAAAAAAAGCVGGLGRVRAGLLEKRQESLRELAAAAAALADKRALARHAHALMLRAAAALSGDAAPALPAGARLFGEGRLVRIGGRRRAAPADGPEPAPNPAARIAAGAAAAATAEGTRFEDVEWRVDGARIHVWGRLSAPGGPPGRGEWVGLAAEGRPGTARCGPAGAAEAAGGGRRWGRFEAALDLLLPPGGAGARWPGPLRVHCVAFRPAPAAAAGAHTPVATFAVWIPALPPASPPACLIGPARTPADAGGVGGGGGGGSGGGPGGGGVDDGCLGRDAAAALDALLAELEAAAAALARLRGAGRRGGAAAEAVVRWAGLQAETDRRACRLLASVAAAATDAGAS
jgi:hypothetical protein